MHQKTREIIKAEMAARGYKSERQLALDCGIGQPTLNRFLAGKTETLEFQHLVAIARQLGLTVSQLIGETPYHPDPKVRVVMLAMEQMPEFKKDMLVAASSSLTQHEDPPAKASGRNRS